MMNVSRQRILVDLLEKFISKPFDSALETREGQSTCKYLVIDDNDIPRPGDNVDNGLADYGLIFIGDLGVLAIFGSLSGFSFL